MTKNANASVSPSIYFFVLFYRFNLLAQFEKMYPWTLKNSNPEDQTERKNDNLTIRNF